MYCNFIKSQAFPLASRVSSQPICFKPFHISEPQFLAIGSPPIFTQNPIWLNFRSPSFGSVQRSHENSNSVKAIKFSIGLHREAPENRTGAKPRKFSCGFSVKNSSLARARGFSTSYFQRVHSKGSGLARNWKTRSWKAAAHKAKEEKKMGKAKVTKTSGSCWEDAGEIFSQRGGTTKESKDGKNRFAGMPQSQLDNYRGGGEKVEGEEDDDSEVAYEKRSRKVRNGKNLPWLEVAHKAKGGRKFEKTISPKASGSSWEESARSFFKKGSTTAAGSENGRNRLVDLAEYGQNDYMERGEGVQEGGEEDDAEEVSDDPRWDKIKSQFRGFSDPKAGFGKPNFQRWNKQENWGRKTWKEASQSTVPKMVGEQIYGVSPVLAALSAGRREFYALYVQEGLDLSSNNRKKKDKKRFEKVLLMADNIGLSRKEVSKHDLNMVVDNRPHQGLVLDASPLEMVGIKELDPVSLGGEKGPIWLALDEVMDPQNLGAIIRSAYFFGASGVVLCAKNSAPLSGVVSKASAGSLELMELRSCRNMMKFLTSSAENGWRVLGGSFSSKSVPLNEVLPGAPTILVLGSEGTGLRPLVERSCTQLIRIPGNIPVDVTTGAVEGVESEEMDPGCSGKELQPFLAVESLNVSVAAGVLLHHLTEELLSQLVEQGPMLPTSSTNLGWDIKLSSGLAQTIPPSYAMDFVSPSGVCLILTSSLGRLEEFCGSSLLDVALLRPLDD
ncbi:uncharacterized protein LOC131157325 [Malania oleifera]|uniref:uncharacterized protein LOC131157325 n=1 Tax=Malania oleifera TaxID=397392 RepID=UPI0025ADA0DA|nr:uncharacterized protein LOC131157325 [Malania oleifera]